MKHEWYPVPGWTGKDSRWSCARCGIVVIMNQEPPTRVCTATVNEVFTRVVDEGASRVKRSTLLRLARDIKDGRDKCIDMLRQLEWSFRQTALNHGTIYTASQCPLCHGEFPDHQRPCALENLPEEEL